jgi:hypothetical protein
MVIFPGVSTKEAREQGYTQMEYNKHDLMRGNKFNPDVKCKFWASYRQHNLEFAGYNVKNGRCRNPEGYMAQWPVEWKEQYSANDLWTMYLTDPELVNELNLREGDPVFPTCAREMLHLCVAVSVLGQLDKGHGDSLE